SVIPAALFAAVGLRDPRRGNEPLGNVTFLSGGNPNLDPEQSVSKSAGLVLTPRVLSGLRASIDWVRITKVGEIRPIGTLNRTVFENEPFLPQLVTRADPAPGDPFGVGKVIAINGTLQNAASTHVEGYDMALEYVHETPQLGTLELSVLGTRQVHDVLKIAPS